MHRCAIAVFALFALVIGCGGESRPAGPPPAVSGSVALEKPQAGAPDAGTSAGHGNEGAIATTSSDVFSFTGRVDPADSKVEVSDGVVRVEPSGRFTVATISPREGAKELRIDATRPGHRPWSLDVRLTRGASARVEVPERDDDAPSAAVMLQARGDGGGVVQPSPSRAGERPEVVTLSEPRFRATAAVRDSRGGTGRIRLSIETLTRCGDTEKQRVQTIPPAQVVNIALPPGAPAPVERQRSARVDLEERPGCSITGELFAEGTDAHGRQAVTAHIGFEYP
jgi:hypothetical protein